MQQERQYHSPIGLLTLCGDDAGLTALHIDPTDFTFTSQTSVSAATCWLDAYFSGIDPGIPTFLAPFGTPFQQLVWKMVQNLPYGEVCSYGTIAKQVAEILGKPYMSAQAVGNAVGRNPLPIFIPCHRVIGADGSLTGYHRGLAIKRALLRLEGVPIVNDIVPHFR